MGIHAAPSLQPVAQVGAADDVSPVLERALWRRDPAGNLLRDVAGDRAAFPWRLGENVVDGDVLSRLDFIAVPVELCAVNVDPVRLQRGLALAGDRGGSFVLEQEDPSFTQESGGAVSVASLHRLGRVPYPRGGESSADGGGHPGVHCSLWHTALWHARQHTDGPPGPLSVSASRPGTAAASGMKRPPDRGGVRRPPDG